MVVECVLLPDANAITEQQVVNLANDPSFAEFDLSEVFSSACEISLNDSNVQANHTYAGDGKEAHADHPYAVKIE